MDSKRDKKHSSEKTEKRKKHKRTSPDSNDDEEYTTTSKNHDKSSRKKRHIEEKPAADDSATKTEEKTELSIEETNKLRAKLGLKPLQIDKPADKTSTNNNVSAEGNQIYHDKDTDQNFEHVPAKNVSLQKQETMLREKLNEQREKRLLQDKFKSTKKLGESDEEDEGAQSWVEKLKQKQLEKEQALKKAKLLEEMDEQFGVSDLVSTEIKSKTAKKPKAIKYTSNDLSGLKVEHAQDTFKEGQSIILTLKDKNVLEEEDDVLINVNIIDEEKAKQNVENKKKKPDYQAYDEFDEYGQFKEKSILNKYDEELEGQKHKSFKLGSGGVYDSSIDQFIDAQNQEFKSRAIKLDSIELKLANDYLTKEEEEKFKKPKKIRKKLRKAVKADDLVPLDEESTSSLNVPKKSEHFGSRKTKASAAEAETANRELELGEIKSETKISLKDIDFNFKKSRQSDEEEEEEEKDDDDELDFNAATVDEHLNLNIKDEAFDELHSALSKIRNRTVTSKLQQINERIIAESELNLAKEKEEEEAAAAATTAGLVIQKGQQRDVEMEDEDAYDRSITLDTMSEFCRNLGEIPTLGRAGNNRKLDEEKNEYELENRMRLAASAKAKVIMSELKEDEDEELVNKMDHDGSEDEEEEKVNKSGGSGGVGDDSYMTNGILDEEPVVDRGLASALQLAVNKGYLIQEKNKQNARRKENITAQNITIEEKNFYDIDDKYTRSRDRYGGPTSDFKEKDGYRPDIKLDYIDETGHRMNEKEAFRYLSHRFHGKGSGKKKTEKRNEKHKELELMQKMSSVDTPLNTVALLDEKKKRLQQPFIVLSAPKGGQITLNKP